MCSCTMHCWMVCFSVVTVFAGPVCVPAPCTVGWSVSVLSLCFRTSMCSCTMHCWMVCFNVVTVFQDQYVFLHHALLDGLFQCCHCVSGPVCVPAPCTVGWSVSMLSLCFRTSMCSCTMHCWMVCFSVVTVFQDQYVFLHHALLDGLFQCCHCVSGPVCVPAPCTVGWSVSVLSLCFRTSMCSCTMHCWMVCFNVVTVFQDQYVFLHHALLDGLFQCCHCVSGPVCVPAPCTVGWSVSMLSLCFRTSMCSCTMHCWMVCFSVVTVFQDQYVFLHHALLDGLFQCCHCVSGPVCVPAPCTVGWSVSVLSLCFRTSMCSCTMHCWMVCFNVVTVFQDQYVFLHHALLDGLFQCCHCVSGPVCVPAPCTVGWAPDSTSCLPCVSIPRCIQKIVFR